MAVEPELRRRGRDLALAVGLHHAARDQRVDARAQRLVQHVVELAQLVAAEAGTGAVLALDPQSRAREVLAEPRHRLERRRQRAEADAAEARQRVVQAADRVAAHDGQARKVAGVGGDVGRALPAHAEAAAGHDLELGVRALRLHQRAMLAVDEVLAVEHQHRQLQRRQAAQRVELGERAHRLPAVAADLELGGVDAVHPRLRRLHRRMLGIVLQQEFYRARRGEARVVARPHLGDVGDVVPGRVGVAEVGDVDQHRLVDALRPARAQRDRRRRADRLAHGEGALDLERIHHLDRRSARSPRWWAASRYGRNGRGSDSRWRWRGSAAPAPATARP